MVFENCHSNLPIIVNVFPEPVCPLGEKEKKHEIYFQGKQKQNIKFKNVVYTEMFFKGMENRVGVIS